jgi:hypothetical protein
MALSEDEISTLKKLISDPTSDLSPWDRVKYGIFLKNYVGPEDKTPEQTEKFRQNYDRYYAPFMSGFGSADISDVPQPNYKYTTPFNSPQTIQKKMKYNKSLNRMSKVDPFLTAGAHGLGMVAAMSGGLPGLAGGYAIKHGVPLAWNLVKNHFANKYARNRLNTKNYRDILQKYPTL